MMRVATEETMDEMKNNGLVAAERGDRPERDLALSYAELIIYVGNVFVAADIRRDLRLRNPGRDRFPLAEIDAWLWCHRFCIDIRGFMLMLPAKCRRSRPTMRVSSPGRRSSGSSRRGRLSGGSTRRGLRCRTRSGRVQRPILIHAPRS
jgi:hypothetical protein